jgi:hypothetical protein
MNIATPAGEAQRCLPASYDTDAGILADERRMLIDAWQLVAHAAELPAPGDVIARAVSWQDTLFSLAKMGRSEPVPSGRQAAARMRRRENPTCTSD